MIKSSGSWAEPPMSAHISTSVTFRVPLGRPFWYLDYALYPLAKARGLTAYYDKLTINPLVLILHEEHQLLELLQRQQAQQQQHLQQQLQHLLQRLFLDQKKQQQH